MKKHLLFAASMLALLGATTACSSNEDLAENTPAAGETITVTAAIGSGAGSRVAYEDQGSTEGMKAKWNKDGGEEFGMYKGTFTSDKVAYGAKATFTQSGTGNTFTGTAPTGDGDTYMALYPSTLEVAETYGEQLVTLDFSASQKGTLENGGITEYMVARSTTTDNLTFDHLNSVLKLTLTLQATEKVSEVTLSGMQNKSYYYVSDGAFASGGKGDITATNGSTGFIIENGKVTVYMSVPPQITSASDNVTITATVGSDSYAYTLKNSATIAAGKVHPVDVTLTKVAAKNFKSAYTDADFKLWDTGAGTVSRDELMLYLGAGVYQDNGDEGTNQQTFTVKGTTYHAGFWLMKKQYISETVTPTVNATITAGRPTEIEKYFFLPAAGGDFDGSFDNPGGYGYYWTSDAAYSSSAYCLEFSIWGPFAKVEYYDKAYCKFLPMVEE